MESTVNTLQAKLQKLVSQSLEYFDKAETYFNEEIIEVDADEDHWDLLDSKLKDESDSIQRDLFLIIGELSKFIKLSPLLTEVDERELSQTAKKARAALRLRKYRSWEIEVLHDEGEVLGVHPPGQSEDEYLWPSDSLSIFLKCVNRMVAMRQLIEVSPLTLSDGLANRNPNLPASYRPNTAFIMMQIDSSSSKVVDVCEAYKEWFEKFNIEAVRADDIEHDDIITNKILEEIRTSEFLLADLTGERPSVYYEVGYAHSLGRRVMLFREKGTHIHFDLAAHNCPEYDGITDLKRTIVKRLEYVTSSKAV